MYLKTLTLRGFKSFATATTLRFEPGINCVVGPNGSGKSNIVDALAWVMGEQGARALRGSAMADVIFAGTAGRPALGRAEVSLTIDNTDGALPIDFSEVTISRTLFRSGGSEYAINGTACRLLDIQELLSDTGMGKEMHVIIGQGKLDEVLTATPEERRYFIEEAAGVLKHRRRKEKALRKLDSMQANLTRIEDLAGELRRQLGPLARQAATARRAQVIQRTVFDARARLLADDIAQAQARLAAQSADEEKLTAERAAAHQAVLALQAEVAQLQAQADQHSPYIATLSERYQRLLSLLERFRSLLALAGERERSLRAPVASSQRGESPEHIRERAAAARAEEQELSAQVQAAETQLAEKIAAREEADRTEDAADRELASVNRTLADRRENAARLAGQLTAARSRLEALTAERERVAGAIADASARAERAAAEVARLEQDAVAHTQGDDTLSLQHERAARELQAAKDTLEAARTEVTQGQAQAVQWRTKAETLALSLEPEDATAWVLNEHRAGVTGLVRDSVHVRAGWEAGIEAALAGAASGVVVRSVEAAVDALRAAREAGAGHVEMMIAGGAAGAGGAGDADGAGGVAGTAASSTDGAAGAANTAGAGAKADPANADLAVQAERAITASKLSSAQAILAASAITGEDATAQAARALLAGTVLAIDLVTAKTLLEQGAPRVATIGGDVLSRRSARGGEVQTAAVLSRQAMYDDALARARKAEAARSQAEQQLAAAQASLATANTAFEELAAQLTARDSELAAVTAQLGVLRQSVDSARAEVDRDTARIAAIDAELAQRNQELETFTAQYQASQAQPADLAARASTLASTRDSAHRAAVRTREEETQARLTLRTTEERLRAVAGRAASLERTAQAAEERIAQEARQAQRRAQAAAAAQVVAEQAEQALAITQALSERVAEQRAAAEQAGTQRNAALSTAREQLDTVRTKERRLDDAGHQRELVLAEQRLKYEQLAQRALESMGMEAAALIEEYGPHLPIPVISEDTPARAAGAAPSEPELAAANAAAKTIPFVRTEQEKRLAKAERDLAKLGKINPLALEEHAALEERQRFLSEQLQDLRRSREDLLKIIRDIDERVQQVMQAALQDVAAAFEKVFATLFPGGEGRLVLTDPASTLTTGVDIEARPPGKRVKRLSLLSGGERSLTAIAFLIAIFKARPSPFYVMDEVEAALDDVNLTRLLDLFSQLRENSQLLVITHQKRTMEIADALYGVAMRERGVTSVVSQRMADVLEA